MPDWDEEKYAKFKSLISIYVDSLNKGVLQDLESVFSEDIVLSRGLIISGKKNVLSFMEKLLNPEKTVSVKFELLDASMGFFNENEAQILLYLQLYQGGVKREIHIESLLMNRTKEQWCIYKIFGIGFSPEEHNRYFNQFLQDFEKGEG